MNKCNVLLFLFMQTLSAFQPKVLVYFSQLGCQGCAKADSVVLKKWPQKFNDLMVVEYVINGSAQNKQLFLSYIKDAPLAAVPMLFFDADKKDYVMGALDILAAGEKVEAMPSMKVLPDFSGMPSLWARDRVLIKNDARAHMTSEEIMAVLFGDDINNKKEVEPQPVKISDGEIVFKKAYDLGNGYILQTEKVVGEEESPLNIPFWKNIKINHSLPILTILFGLADGFNPCAFFILTFLLAAMLFAASNEMSKADKRKRILLVGFTFVFFSALIYFLFMGLWFNVFRFLDKGAWLTWVAGAIAIFAGIINIKDYFFFQRGISCTLPKSEKLKFVDKVEKLKFVRSWTGLLLGTIIVAITVNLYELLCTLGLPMVYLRILTLHNVSTVMYYVYLALYCLIYVLPLLIIILLFAYTLGGCEFSKENIKRLKLVSGFMVLFLGCALLFKPALLKSGLLSLSLVVLAILISLCVMLVYEKFLKLHAQL